MSKIPTCHCEDWPCCGCGEVVICNGHLVTDEEDQDLRADEVAMLSSLNDDLDLDEWYGLADEIDEVTASGYADQLVCVDEDSMDMQAFEDRSGEYEYNREKEGA